ncbi:MAG: SpoIID/LytB domain-containing protein [Patescibacteria group bacterium]|nr:SpoIID/LytB domain-containing protein [Patescibacteria group bacterium]
MKRLLVFFLIVFGLFFFLQKTLAESIDDEIEKIKQELGVLSQNLKEKEADFEKINQKLNQIKNQVVLIEQEILKKETEVKKGEVALGYQKKILNLRAASYYKNITKSSFSLLSFIAAENLGRSLENFFYQKFLVDEDRKTILKIIFYIKNLEEQKKLLEEEKINLVALKKEVDRQSRLLNQEISQTREKIASLTARQQQLLAQKLASLNIPRSAGTGLRGCVDDREIDPGFSPRFAFFTFGVPNRVGLNQWGAKGRAEAGQNAEEILRAYYENFELKKDYDTGINIEVEGFGVFNIEDYLKRIYEMPADWPLEALKAQAVAARSYALAYTNNGTRPICATDYCQVFKPEEKGELWNQAVEETRGWVMIQNNSPIKAWYSSTHGGYIFNSTDVGWLNASWTKHGPDYSGSVNSFSELQNNAYDKNSPWFYCDWGSRSEYNKTAWLKPEEVADIVNVILLARYLSLEDKEHLYQVDKPNPSGKEIWDASRVKNELINRGSSFFSSINHVSVNVDFGYGKTVSLTFQGDGGSVSIDGREFKDWFNLRAPSNIQIVGPLYNVEKK